MTPGSKHLSRVVGLTPGAARILRATAPDVPALALLSPADAVFDRHQGLRARRTVYPHRANALENPVSPLVPPLIPFTGTSAVMPKWTDLRLYVALDYDLSSAITATISLRATWLEPFPDDRSLRRRRLAWGETSADKLVFPVDQRDIGREREEFIKFLRKLKEILDAVAQQDNADLAASRRAKQSTYQIYLWDEAQLKHLVRLAGRHLNAILADPGLRDLAWLFPPPELLPNHEDAARRSPVTLVHDAVGNHVALPVPHHYTLLKAAKDYKKPKAPAPSVHPLYEDPLTNLVPVERVHEWWNRRGNYALTQERIVETAYRKAMALGVVVERLEEDLKATLSDQAAPPILAARDRLSGVAPHSHLWYQFTRLNGALQNLDKQTTRALPSHEREARLKAARLRRRLDGAAKQRALDLINAACGTTLAPEPNLYVYELRDNSREVNFRVGDFDLALSPESTPSFLDTPVWKLVKGTTLETDPAWKRERNMLAWRITGVTLEGIDRERGLVALRAGGWCRVDTLERHTIADFSRHVVLDEMELDLLSEKVKLTLAALKEPDAAGGDAATYRALGLTPKASVSAKQQTPTSPAVDFLWTASATCCQPVSRGLPAAEAGLWAGGVDLNPSQWVAWRNALTRRLSLVWGPPGTGKSKTVRAIALGAVLDAVARGKPLRLLVTAGTYNAVDNVLLELERDLLRLLPHRPYEIYRLQSTHQPVDPRLAATHPTLHCVVVDRRNPSSTVEVLRNRLDTNNGIVVVGSVAQQCHNLAVARHADRPRGRDTLREWFDLVLFDEASQLDVAASTLIFTKTAPDAACVLAGDDLQLPPIHQAEPPDGLEPLLGSVFNFMAFHHGVPKDALDTNYRSNDTLVAFTRLAGYSAGLHSHSPDLKLNLLKPLPTARPASWPAHLFWTPSWSEVLDDARPAACFVYDDDASGQSNAFEADAVAALLWLLHGRLADQPLNELDKGGVPYLASSTPYTDEAFWNRAVGVVAPHRAQVSKVVAALQRAFPGGAAVRAAIRGAVDTVERFQGQQRDVIVASFGLGDPDVIRAEEEFLYDLNRFNVMASRARAKLVVLTTQTLLDHLSNDQGVLRGSGLLKRFAESYCRNRRPLTLGFLDAGLPVLRNGELRDR